MKSVKIQWNKLVDEQYDIIEKKRDFILREYVNKKTPSEADLQKFDQLSFAFADGNAHYLWINLGQYIFLEILD